MSTIQLTAYSSSVARVRIVAVVTLMHLLPHATNAIANGSADPSKPATVIANRYEALRKGDIHAFAAVHKDPRWIKESEFRPQHERFSKYVIRQQKRTGASEKPRAPEVYFAVDEYYKGQSDPTRMHFVVRLERNRWLIVEFNADEPRSPTEKSVEEKAKRMLNKK